MNNQNKKMKKRRKPALKNIWYNLATIAGEPDRKDIELQKLNRHYWHGLMRFILSSDECLKIETLCNISLPTLSDKELAFITSTLYHRKVDANFGRLKAASSMKLSSLVFGYVDFSGFIFPRPVAFNNSVFKHKTIFLDTVFIEDCGFHDSEFMFNAEFNQAKFYKNSDFCGAVFRRTGQFSRASFLGGISFEHSEFNELVKFNSSSFKGEVDFRKTCFESSPPEFFNSTVSENILWGGSTFPDHIVKNKKLRRKSFNTSKPRWKSSFNHRAVRHINSYERLALMMSKLEKHHDRHMFFRLEMRARRLIETNIFAKFLNYSYDKISDYGYGVSLTATAWAINIFGWMPLLFPWRGYKLDLSTVENWVTCLNLWVEAFGLSLANSLNFLGLSKGPLKHVVESYPREQMLAPFAYSFIGSIQTIFGAVLLFLLILCVRNRFRMS